MKRLWLILLVALAAILFLWLRDDPADRAVRAGRRPAEPAPANATGTAATSLETERRTDNPANPSGKRSHTLTVTGTVSRQDGTPIQGATVRAPHLDGASSAITEADGTYVLGNMPYGSYPFGASAPGRASSIKQSSFVQDPVRIDFVLGEGSELFGRVTDQNGEPVRGVRLSAFLARDRSVRLRGVKSTESGAFAFDDAREGSWWIQLMPPREGRWSSGRELLVSPADSPLDLRLSRAVPGIAALHVEIVEAGTRKPLRPERVFLSNGDSLGVTRSISLEFSDGQFRTTRLQPGRWKLRFKTPAGAVERAIAILEGEQVVYRLIEVGAPGSVRGRAIPQGATDRPSRLTLITEPAHEGKWVRSAAEGGLPVTGGFATLNRDRAYAFRMGSIRSRMTIWLVVQGKNLYGRAKVVVAPGEDANVDVPVLPSGTLTLRLPSDFRARPVRVTCWPESKPEWRQIGTGVARSKGLQAAFVVPVGLVHWRVEYPDPNSGERKTLAGSIEVLRGEAVVVEPELE